MPSQPNTVSVITAPSITVAKLSVITVTTGISAVRKAWRSTTCVGRRPLAFAVRT